MKKEPPDVINYWPDEPLITEKNWLDLMEWAKNRDQYLYYRALSNLILIQAKTL